MSKYYIVRVTDKTVSVKRLYKSELWKDCETPVYTCHHNGKVVDGCEQCRAFAMGFVAGAIGIAEGDDPDKDGIA